MKSLGKHLLLGAALIGSLSFSAGTMAYRHHGFYIQGLAGYGSINYMTLPLFGDEYKLDGPSMGVSLGYQFNTYIGMEVGARMFHISPPNSNDPNIKQLTSNPITSHMALNLQLPIGQRLSAKLDWVWLTILTIQLKK